MNTEEPRTLRDYVKSCKDGDVSSLRGLILHEPSCQSLGETTTYEICTSRKEGKNFILETISCDMGEMGRVKRETINLTLQPGFLNYYAFTKEECELVSPAEFSSI